MHSVDVVHTIYSLYPTVLESSFFLISVLSSMLLLLMFIVSHFDSPVLSVAFLLSLFYRTAVWTQTNLSFYTRAQMSKALHIRPLCRRSVSVSVEGFCCDTFVELIVFKSCFDKTDLLFSALQKMFSVFPFLLCSFCSVVSVLDIVSAVYFYDLDDNKNITPFTPLTTSQCRSDYF